MANVLQDLKAYLKKKVDANGIKFMAIENKSAMGGAPTHVLVKNGHVVFLVVKTSDLTLHQQVIMSGLTTYGANVRHIKTRDDVNDLIDDQTIWA